MKQHHVNHPFTRFGLKLLVVASLLISLRGAAQTWQDISANVPGTITSGNQGVMATDGTRLYVLGQAGVFVSEDGGNSFTAVNAVQDAGYNLGQYGHRFVGIANGLVWVGTDPGSAAFNDGLATLHRLTPGQTTWQKSSTGFPVGTTGNQADDLAYDASTGTYYAVGALGGVFVSTDGVNWEARNNGNGGLGLPATVEAFNGVAFSVRPLGGVYRTTDQGLNWTATGGIPGPGSGTLLRLGGRLMIATQGYTTLQDGLYYSDDLGVTWTFTQALNNQFDLTTDGTLGFAAGAGGNLFFTGTGGVTWDAVPTTGITGSPNRLLRVGNQLFVHTAGKLFRIEVSSVNLVPSTRILRPPVGGGVNEGGSFTMSVEVAGAAPFTYVWKNDGSPIPGAPNSPSYTITGATSANAGSYTVEITGGGGAIESNPVTVNYAPFAPGNIDFTFLPATVNGSVYSVAQSPEGSVFFGGAFTSAQGKSRQSVAKTDIEGRLDAAFASSTATGADIFALLPLPGGEVIAGGGADGGNGQYWRRYRTDGNLVGDWPWPIELNNSTYKAVLLANGKILVGGRFATGLVRLNSDGFTDKTWVGTANLGPVRDFAVQPDGKIVVVGEFTTPANRVARLNADGTVDNTFSVGTGANQTVYAVALQADGKIVIGGNFTSLNGVARNRLARLEANGSLDNVFDPGAGPNALVRDVVLAADGSLYIGGNFTAVGAATRGYFARLTATGALDATYPDPLFNGQVYALALQPDGHLLAGGAFTTVNGFTAAGLIRLLGEQAGLAITAHPAGQRVDLNGSAIFRVKATGTSAISYQWRRNGVNLSDTTGISGTTSATLTLTSVSVAQQGNYDVVVSNGSGSQTSLAAALLVNASPVIEVQPSGGTVARGNAFTLSVAGRGLAPLTYQWQKDSADIPNATNVAFTVGSASAGDAGGYTVRIQNGSGAVTSDSAVVSVVEKPGLVENIFRLVGSGPGSPELVDVADAGGGKLYVAGYFSSWNGDNNKDGIVRLNADGSLDTGFGNNGGIVIRFAVQPDGKVLVAGGIGFKRLNTNGTVDNSFNPGTVNGSDILALLVQPDGKILVGGDFTTINGESYPLLVRLNPDGSIDRTFYVGAGFGGSFPEVDALAIQPDGKVLVGGVFATYQGVPVKFLVRLNANGTLDSTFAPPTLNGGVKTLALQADGRVVVGGSFIQVGGQDRQKLVRLNADGNFDPTFVPGNAIDGTVLHVLSLPGGKTLVAGQFNYYGGTLANGLLRLNSDGTLDTEFAANLGLGARGTTRVNRLALLADGKIGAVGAFYDFDQQARWYATKILNEQPALAFLAQPANTTPALGDTLRLSVSAMGSSAISYQWRKGGVNLADGGNISGRTSATLVITGVGTGDAGEYDVVISNASGSQTSAAVTVSPIAGPIVLTPPASKNVVTTQTLNLGVTAIGTGTLSYQWRKGGVNLSNGGAISGATTANLVIANAQTSDSGSYDVVITDTIGSTTSAAAQVTVIVQPGSLDLSWTPASFNGQIEDVLYLPDGRIVVAGTFTTVGGVARSQVAMLNANGTLNTTFASTATLTSILNNSRRLARMPDGRILLSVSTASTGGVYSYDSAGARTSLFSEFFGSNIIGDLFAEDDTHVVIVGGNGSSGFVKRYMFNGSSWIVDSSFNGPGFNSTVQRVVRQPDGRYVVAGFFTTVNGQFAPRVIRLHANGTWDTSFVVSSGHTGDVYALALDGDGNIYVGGTITYLGGVSPLTGVARLGPDGTGDSTYKPNLGDVRDIIIQPDGKAIFTGRNTSNGKGIFRLNSDGTSDGTFDPGSGVGTTSYIYAAAQAPNGDLYIGGDFSNYNGTARSRFAKVNNDPVHLAFITHPIDRTVDQGQDVAFTMQTYGSSTINYQWLKNGNPLADGGRISGATTATLTVTAALGADDGTYTVRITNLAGQQTSRPAQLTVLGAPVFIGDLPPSLNFIAGSNVVLLANAKAASTSTYTWRKDGLVLTNSSRITNATTAALTFNGILPVDAGVYQLTISNVFGIATSAASTVTVTVLPAARDTTFRAPSGANNYVYDVALLPDGGALAGGAFTTIGGVASNYFARLDSNGNGVGASGIAYVNSTVTGIWPLPSGKFLISGSFTTVNGSGTYQRLARLNGDGSLDTSFVCPLNVTANAAVGLPDGSIIIGGAFNTTYNTVTYQYLAKLDATGAPVSTFGSKVNGTVNDLALQPDGRLVVAGQFAGTFTGGSYNTAYTRLARFNADESADTSYVLSPNSIVQRLQVLEDGKIFALGSFTSIGGQTRKYLARLNTDGTVDTGFNPPSTLNATPISFAVQQNGKVLISGPFTVVVTGQTHYQLARLNADGTLDTGFETGTELYYNNNTLNYALNVRLEPNGRIWLAGQLNAYDGVPVSYLTRLFGETPDLAIAIHPVSQTVNRGTTVTFTASAVGTSAISYQWQKNGQNLPGETGSTLTLPSVPDSALGVYQLVASNLSGSRTSKPATLVVLGNVIITSQPQSLVKTLGQSATFAVTAIGATPLSYQWRKNGTNIAGATGTSYTIGGAFAADAATYDVVVSNVHGSVASAGASLSVQGSTTPAGTPGTLNSNFTAATFSGSIQIYGVNRDAQGRVYVTGTFTGYGGQTRNRFLRLNPDLTLDTTFAPSFNNYTYAVEMLPGGGFLVGGNQATVDSTTLYGLARFSSSDILQTTPVLSNFAYLDGGASPNGIWVNADGSYFIGGSFSSVGGTTRNNLAKIKADGTLDTSFAPMAYPAGPVRGVAVDSSGRVIALGNFSTTFGGAAHVGIACYDSTGALDATFTPQVDSAANSPVAAGFQSTGKIILIGFFSSVKDNPSSTVQTRYGIARLNTDGTVDTAFNANLDLNADVYDMIIQPDDKIVIVGSFTSVNGTTRQRLARLNADGTLDTSFGSTSGASSTIYSIIQLAAGDYIIGGLFTSFGGDATKKYLARVHGEPPTPPARAIVRDPISLTIAAGQTATFSVAVTGTAPLGFQWRKGGTNLIFSANSPDLVLTNVQPADAGNYDVIVTDANGSTTSAVATLTLQAGQTFADWAFALGLAGGQNGPNDDPDNDRLPNLGEFAFGSLPTQSNSANRPTGFSVNDGGTIYPAVRYVRNKLAAGITIHVTAATSVTFNPTVGTTTLAPVDLGGDLEQITVRANTPLNATPTVFFHVTVSQP